MPVPCFLLVVVLVLAACGAKPGTGGKLSTAERDAIIRQTAIQYTQDRDLPKAKAALDKLKLANPAQLIVTIAEQAQASGKPASEIAALARLADALGTRSLS